MPLRIYVDFNTMMVDEEERVSINAIVEKNLLEYLRPGLPVVLYDEEMEVDAIVEFHQQSGQWLGRPDWSTRRDLLSGLET